MCNSRKGYLGIRQCSFSLVKVVVIAAASKTSGGIDQCSKILKHRFCKTACCTLSISSGVTRNGQPLWSLFCILDWPSLNCPRHHMTLLLLIMLGPHTWHDWQRISPGNCFQECCAITTRPTVHKTEPALHYSHILPLYC